MQKLTQKDLDGTFAHIIMTVKCFSIEGTHFFADQSRVVIEEFNEAFENIQMEGWSDQFSVCPPLVAYVNF